jgi:hypothetical protein
MHANYLSFFLLLKRRKPTNESLTLNKDEFAAPPGRLCVGSYSLTPYSMFLLEKLVGPQMFKKLPYFMEFGSSLPRSERPTTGYHPQIHERSPQIPIFLKIYFRVDLLSMPRRFICSLFLSLACHVPHPSISP